MGDFSECIIIPLAMFEQCNFRQEAKTSSTVAHAPTSSILYNQTLPSDLKMKLYHQEKRLKQSSVTKPGHTTAPRVPAADVDSILQEISAANHSKASTILAKMLQQKNLISWNEKLEVTINGIHYPNSNIIELLRYVLGDKIPGSLDDVPLAASIFRIAIKELKVPATWLRKEFKVKQSQIGRGWLKL